MRFARHTARDHAIAGVGDAPERGRHEGTVEHARGSAGPGHETWRVTREVAMPVAVGSRVTLDPDDEFAGELRSVHPPRLPSTWAPRIRAAFLTGVKAGLLPSMIVLVVYFVLNHEAGLPWVRIASILALYGPGIGVLLATFVELFVMLTDRIARIWFPLRAIANPVTAGGLAGMLAGIAPGAIGVVVFGSYHGPFVGTGLIAFGLIAGAVMVAVPLAVRARRARRIPDDNRVIAAATVIATLILCAVAAVVAPIIVGSAFDEARSGVDEYGGIVGAVAGALGGGVVGVFIGLVIALGRSLRRNHERVPEVARR